MRETLSEFWSRVADAFLRRWHALDLWVDARFSDGEQAAADGALAHQFKSDAAAIEESRVPVGTHAALYVVAALLVIAILWAVFGTVDRIVVAPGKIATRTPMIVLQPFSTSRITDIVVKPGDHVRKGQLLVTFDPAFAQADAQSQRQKVATLTAQAERIEAEMSLTPVFAVAPGDTRERLTQAQIFNQEMSEYSAEMAVRDSREGEIDAQIRADKATVDGLKKQVDMTTKIVAIRKYLMDQNAGGRLDVMKAESDQIDATVHLQTTLGDLKKLTEQRAEIEAERQTVLDKWHSDHNQQLVQTRQDLAEATETLNKASRMEDYTKLKAPLDGVVLEIADRSVGSVMREGETLITMVPDSADLYVEANVASRDVSYIKVGNTVRVKLEAYPFQKFGTLIGRLDVISADSVPLKQDSEHPELVYKAQVPLTETAKQLVARGISLRPGLVATAEITTGRRSIASYILNPILRTADEGMKEP